jgi:hypothetical protein
VLAGVLDRDGQQLSATQTRQQALADADHLAVLHAIWAAETAAARQRRYRDLLLAALPPEHRREPGHQARWLWRTLRGAELAGLDAGQFLPTPSPNGTWPEPATCPASSMPGSGTGSAAWSRFRSGPCPRRCTVLPTPNVAPGSPRSPR